MESINGVEHTTNYTYDYENRLTETSSGDISQTLEYDDLGRLEVTKLKQNSTQVLLSEIAYTPPVQQPMPPPLSCLG